MKRQWCFNDNLSFIYIFYEKAWLLRAKINFNSMVNQDDI